METGDVVYDDSENSGNDEGIGGTGDNIGNLDIELFIVVVEPAAGNDSRVDAVQTDYIICSKKGVEN